MMYGCPLGALGIIGRLLLWAWVVGPGSSHRHAEATVVEGRLPEEPNFALFLTKFCYDFLSQEEETVGQVQLDLRRLGPVAEKQWPSSGRLLFLIYDDERVHWTKAQRRWETSTCAEKSAAASDVVDIKLDPGKLETTYIVNIREHVRPRFWYFALAACDMQIGDPVRYRMHMKNNIWGWQSEFSLDHMGLFFLYAFATVAFGLATAATAYVAKWEVGPDRPALRDHPFLQLLMLSYVASLASCVLFLLHYALFVRDGSGSKRIRFMAVLASIVANCTIFLIAILSSVGWGITNFVMPNRRCFLGMILFVGGLSALSELHAETTVDDSTKLYSYQSGLGVLSLVLKIFIFCWFAYQTKSTFDEELHARFRRFYKYLGISITGWSLNVPVTVLLAFELSPWVRYKVVTTVEIIARLLGQMLLSQLLCGPLSPITADNTFPSQQDFQLDANFGQLNDGHD